MNRSRFYFLFYLFAISGILMFGFLINLDPVYAASPTQVCIRAYSDTTPNNWKCTPSGGGESQPTDLFGTSGSPSIEGLELQVTGGGTACITTFQTHDGRIIETAPQKCTPSGGGPSGSSGWTGSKSIEGAKVRLNGEGELCIQTYQAQDGRITQWHTLACSSGGGSESVFSGYLGSGDASLEGAKIKFTPSAQPLSVSCSPKNSTLNVGDVRTFTGSASDGTQPYQYQWSGVTCGEEWTCSSNGRISSTENQCRNSCSGSCSHTSGQNIQSCKLFFGAPGTFTPTVTVNQTAADSCNVNVVSQNGSVHIKRVDNNLNPISGTKANVDATINQTCTASDCNANPARWDGFVTSGGHGAHATDLAGFTEKVGTCVYPIGGTECRVTSFFSTPACGGGDCNFGISVTAGQVTKAVYQYTSAPSAGTVEARGIVDGAERPFNVNYAVNGPSSASGSSVPKTFANRNAGAYSLSGISGFPSNYIFDGWDCAPSNCALNAGQTLFLRMRFHTGPTNQLPVGTHDANDNASCTAQGWTTDPDDRNIDLVVKIYSDGSLVKTDTANRFRPDLQSAGVCPGGTCAFVTSLSGAISPGVNHSIEVKGVDAQTGQEQSLRGTPKSIICPAAQTCDTSYPSDQFHACYFDGTNPPTGANPVLAQNNESGIDHDWGFGQVNATGKSDNVSGIWRGRINFAAGQYIFHTLSDDGVALNLEGFGDIISNWTDHAPTQNNSSSIILPAGSRNVTLKWYENGGGARVKLWWETTAVSANNASCSGITAPPTVTPGQSFNASVTMQNTGTKTWTTDSTPHRLGSQNPQDNSRWRDGRVALPGNVAPNANVTFNFNNTAPSIPGTYPFDWKMVEDGVEWFGQTCTKSIMVGGGCTDDCSPSGVQQCTGASSYRVCGNFDSDSCLEWGSSNSCPAGQICSGGSCGSQTLAASLTANPSSEDAPLNGVDLTATPFGTAVGTITYKFDCTNDGTFEHIFSHITEEPKTVEDACNYPTAGSYTARVLVERGSAPPASAFANIQVNPGVPPPQADIRANDAEGSTTITYGASAIIEWCGPNAVACANADSCFVSPTGWTGTSGVRSTGSLTASQTYTLTCVGAGGTRSDSVTVNVSIPPLTVSCTVSPAEAKIGDTVTWSASASGGTGSYTYLWRGDSPLEGKTGREALVSYTTEGAKNGRVAVSSPGAAPEDSPLCVNTATGSTGISITKKPPRFEEVIPE